VVLYGEHGMHEKYGKQFTAHRFEYDTDYDVEGIANYIASTRK